MIPRVGKGGSSFKGAGQYYLHDKDASTSERVAFTHTMNMHTDDPEKALKVMAWTASHQKDLKLAAGVKATGRKLEKPVYTYSLSWAPEETPSPEEMVSAMKDSLRSLKMDDREILLVAHTDTNAPHIHAIVNRVHPENGIAASTSRDHLKLSRWAEAYERDQGKIRVHARVNHNARRDKGGFVKNQNLTREEYEWVKRQYARDPEIIREERKTQQQADREQLSKRLIRRQGLLEAAIAKDYGKTRKALKSEIQATEARIGKPGFFRAVARKITGAEKRDHTALTQLNKSLENVDWRIKERRDAMKADYGREWGKMERRHAAELVRDEAMIERARGEGKRDQAGERMRKGFRVRGGKETAKHSPTLLEKNAAIKAQKKAAQVKRSDSDGGASVQKSETVQKAVARAEKIKKRNRSRDRNRDRSRDRER